MLHHRNFCAGELWVAIWFSFCCWPVSSKPKFPKCRSIFVWAKQNIAVIANYRSHCATEMYGKTVQNLNFKFIRKDESAHQMIWWQNDVLNDSLVCPSLISHTFYIRTNLITFYGTGSIRPIIELLPVPKFKANTTASFVLMEYVNSQSVSQSVSESTIVNNNKQTKQVWCHTTRIYLHIIPRHFLRWLMTVPDAVVVMMIMMYGIRFN